MQEISTNGGKKEKDIGMWCVGEVTTEIELEVLEKAVAGGFHSEENVRFGLAQMNGAEQEPAGQQACPCAARGGKEHMVIGGEK